MQHEPAALPDEEDWIAGVRSLDHGFFRALPRTQLALLARTARGILVRADDLLWTTGSDDRLFGWIHQGRMRIERDGAVIDIMQPGDVLGLSSIHDRPHTAAVRAIDDTLLSVWDGAVIRRVLESDPGALIAALGAVTELVGTLNAELVLLRTRAHATQLVAWHLVRMERAGRSTIDLTHAQLASRIGISARVLHDAFGALARAGVIRLEPVAGRDDDAIVIDEVARVHAVAMGRELVPLD